MLPITELQGSCSPKSPHPLMMFDLLLLLSNQWSVLKRDLTLDPIWFPHWPICRCTISRIFCASDPLVATTSPRLSSCSPQKEPSACCSISYTQPSPAPGALLYPRGCHGASQGSSQPQALHQQPRASLLPGHRYNSTGASLSALESSIVTCIPSQLIPGLCAAAWCMNICAYSSCVGLFYIRHNIYTNICAYVEIIAPT